MSDQLDEPGRRERTLELDRVVNFSDAVFAIAATLLVLSIGIPLDLKGNLDRKLWSEYQDRLPELFAYALSFWVITRNWLAHHRSFRIIRRIDPPFVALNLVLLGLVALVPFPTEVFGKYPDATPATVVYAAAIGTVGLASSALWFYATHRHRLIDRDTPSRWVTHSRLRGLTTPAVFLASIPIAFVSVSAAKYFWLLLVPLRFGMARRYGRITDMP